MNPMKSEKAVFKTEDGVEVSGDYYPADGAGAVILLHMMPKAKESWRDFALKLNENGFSALAIDLRGHGESTKGKGGRVLDYEKFSDREHQESIKDIEAAADFLAERGIKTNNIALVGASIGANLALRYQTEHPDVAFSALLSPGLDYRGVKTEPLAEKIGSGQFVFLAAGGEGDEYSTESAKKLHGLLDCAKEIKIMDGAGHGTNMFLKNPELADRVVELLADVLKSK